ncbi:hypothetical protein M758_4G056500 [Ceratodon purpureus]|nr:hypothetical protein M758_4G056500 [Ceratodon purpureus]
MGWLSVAPIVDLHFMTRFLLILLCSRVRLRFSQVEFLVGVGARTEHSAVASRGEHGFGEQFDDATLQLIVMGWVSKGRDDENNGLTNTMMVMKNLPWSNKFLHVDIRYACKVPYRLHTC